VDRAAAATVQRCDGGLQGLGGEAAANRDRPPLALNREMRRLIPHQAAVDKANEQDVVHRNRLAMLEAEQAPPNYKLIALQLDPFFPNRLNSQVRTAKPPPAVQAMTQTNQEQQLRSVPRAGEDDCPQRE
jgi:hypothetical protein